MTPQIPSSSRWFVGGAFFVVAVSAVCCGVIALGFGESFYSSGFRSGVDGFAFFANLGGLVFGAFRLTRLVDGGLLGLLRRRSGGRVRAGVGSNGERFHAPSGYWRALCVVSWMMPRSAGRRWLGETESVAFEISDERRAKALRSMVWSAPETAALMWLGELSRWTGLAIFNRGRAGYK